jgi:hypothetical protein
MRRDRGRLSATRTDEALEKSRDSNIRRLLVAATRAVNRHITAELQRRGYEKTRPGHAALLANLDLDGNSVTEIAERAQISKQAMARPSSSKAWGSVPAGRARATGECSCSGSPGLARRLFARP